MDQQLRTFSLASRDRLALEVARRLLTRSYDVHTHDHTELFIVLNGSAVHVVDGRRFFIRAGDVYVLRSGCTHGFSQVNNLEHYNIGFSPRLPFSLGDEVRRIEGFQRLFILTPGVGGGESGLMSRLQLTLVDLRRAESIAESIRQALDSHDAGCEPLARARFVELVVFLSRMYGEHISPAADGLLRLARAASHIETHFTEAIRMEDLAAMAGLSTSHFARLFRRHYQVSPGAYAQSLRVQHAAHLLAAGGRSVTSIALESGFSDSNYFARQFRRFMAMTPREYRQRNRRPEAREADVI